MSVEVFKAGTKQKAETTLAYHSHKLASIGFLIPIELMKGSGFALVQGEPIFPLLEPPLGRSYFTPKRQLRWTLPTSPKEGVSEFSFPCVFLQVSKDLSCPHRLMLLFTESLLLSTWRALVGTLS